MNSPLVPTLRLDAKTTGRLARKGAVPVALVAALTSPVAFHHLERWEGNVLRVYADTLAGGLPTWCAGRTGREAKVGTRLTADDCREVNKVTLLEYGYAVLGCVEWAQLTEARLIALTMFAVNVGKEGACSSRAVRFINAGQVIEGCNALVTGPTGQPVWSFAGGRFVQGLANRRKAERALCLESQA
jgi:lysozyme